MLNLLHKKCEVCGTKIRKLNGFWEMFSLKSGRKLICPKCDTKYSTLKLIQWIAKPYEFFLIWMFSILLIVYFIDSFKLSLGGEVWLYGVLLYVALEFLVMVLLPLKEIKTKEKN